MATETDRLAKSVIGDTPTDAPVLTLRMGEIKAVNGILGMVDLTLGGASGDELIPGVRHLSNYRPQIDDACWVLVSGPDLLVIDRTSNSGPSVISDANSALIDPEETRTSTAFGDLATFGPSIPDVDISPSGLAIVSVACWSSNDNAAGGSVMGVQWTQTTGGTFVRAPSLIWAKITNKMGAAKWIGGANTFIVQGTPAGKYTLTAKYASLGSGAARFNRRVLSVIPL